MCMRYALGRYFRPDSNACLSTFTYSLLLYFYVMNTTEDDEEIPLALDWEILACILRRLHLGIQLNIEDESQALWDIVRYPEALPGLARVIRGHTMITGFSFEGITCQRLQRLETLCSILLTLPALKHVLFRHRDGQDTEEAQSCESVIQLLRLPTLRQVEFYFFAFTNILSKAVAKALKERSGITGLNFVVAPSLRAEVPRLRVR
jgi:hypothetical protein